MTFLVLLGALFCRHSHQAGIIDCRHIPALNTPVTDMLHACLHVAASVCITRTDMPLTSCWHAAYKLLACHLHAAGMLLALLACCWHTAGMLLALLTAHLRCTLSGVHVAGSCCR